MADKAVIAKQVAELTKEQQDTLVRVGKIGMAFLIPGAIIGVIGALIGVFAIMGADYTNSDKIFTYSMIWDVICVVYIAVVYICMKVKCPYYSDAKARYIINLRKGK